MNKGLAEKFGARLRLLRLVSRMTLQDVADKTGVTNTHICYLEKGRTQNPGLKLLLALANVFNMSVSELIEDMPHTKSRRKHPVKK
jgi:transcriptional regulator with XRE-family HTH domain